MAEWRLALQDGTVAVVCLHFTVEKPTASAESRGTYDGLPFRAYFAADLWGDNKVTLLMCAFSDDVLKPHIRAISHTYE